MKRKYHEQQKDMISEYRIMQMKTNELLQISPNFPVGRRKQQEIINHFPLPVEKENQAVKEESERYEQASIHVESQPHSEVNVLESQENPIQEEADWLFTSLILGHLLTLKL